MKKKLLVNIFLTSFIANIFSMEVVHQQKHKDIAEDTSEKLIDIQKQDREVLHEQEHKDITKDTFIIQKLIDIQKQDRTDAFVLIRNLLNQESKLQECINLFAIPLLGLFINIDLPLSFLPLSFLKWNIDNLDVIKKIRENRLSSNLFSIIAFLLIYNIYTILKTKDSIYYQIIYTIMQKNIKEMKEIKKDFRLCEKHKTIRLVPPKSFERFYIIQNILEKSLKEDKKRCSKKELIQLNKILNGTFKEDLGLIENTIDYNLQHKILFEQYFTENLNQGEMAKFTIKSFQEYIRNNIYNENLTIETLVLYLNNQNQEKDIAVMQGE